MVCVCVCVVCEREREKGAYPCISTIRANWLYSLCPGKSGMPRKSSAAMHPNDHMSMDVVYLLTVQQITINCQQRWLMRGCGGWLVA
jgi:hypothetical protein